MLVLLALIISPDDEVIARSALPCGRAKAQESDQVIYGADPITQLRARERFIAEVVIVVNEFIPQTRVRKGAD